MRFCKEKGTNPDIKQDSRISLNRQYSRQQTQAPVLVAKSKHRDLLKIMVLLKAKGPVLMRRAPNLVITAIIAVTAKLSFPKQAQMPVLKSLLNCSLESWTRMLL